MTTREREFDIIVLGAAGVTGRHLANYLARRYKTNTRFALADIDGERLLKVCYETNENESGDEDLYVGGSQPTWPCLISYNDADASKFGAMVKLTCRCRVLVSCVGPYYQYGDNVITACLTTSTHYVDMTGEVNFVKEMRNRFHSLALARGVVLIHFCGLVSALHDLGMHMIEQEFEQDLASLNTNTLGICSFCQKSATPSTDCPLCQCRTMTYQPRASVNIKSGVLNRYTNLNYFSPASYQSFTSIEKNLSLKERFTDQLYLLGDPRWDTDTARPIDVTLHEIGKSVSFADVIDIYPASVIIYNKSCEAKALMGFQFRKPYSFNSLVTGDFKLNMKGFSSCMRGMNGARMVKDFVLPSRICEPDIHMERDDLARVHLVTQGLDCPESLELCWQDDTKKSFQNIMITMILLPLIAFGNKIFFYGIDLLGRLFSDGFIDKSLQLLLDQFLCMMYIVRKILTVRVGRYNTAYADELMTQSSRTSKRNVFECFNLHSHLHAKVVRWGIARRQVFRDIHVSFSDYQLIDAGLFPATDQNENRSHKDTSSSSPTSQSTTATSPLRNPLNVFMCADKVALAVGQSQNAFEHLIRVVSDWMSKLILCGRTVFTAFGLKNQYEHVLLRVQDCSEKKIHQSSTFIREKLSSVKIIAFEIIFSYKQVMETLYFQVLSRIYVYLRNLGCFVFIMCNRCQGLKSILQQFSCFDLDREKVEGSMWIIMEGNVNEIRGKTVSVSFGSDVGSPGHVMTSIILAESALSLVKNPDSCPCFSTEDSRGFNSPASALGTVLFNRLVDAGFRAAVDVCGELGNAPISASGISTTVSTPTAVKNSKKAQFDRDAQEYIPDENPQGFDIMYQNPVRRNPIDIPAVPVAR